MNDRNDAAEALARAIEGEAEEGQPQAAETHEPHAQASKASGSDHPGEGDGGAAADVADAGLMETDEIASGQYAGSTATVTGRPSGGGRPRRTSEPTAVARFTVKACLVLGMLLVVPGLWAVGLLAGLSVPMSGRDHADKVAYLMLLCWPIAAILVGGALFYARQHARQSKEL